MHDSRKQVRKSKRIMVVPADQCIDRISNLPETVMSHILAYLPTKYAVATGILSRRWKHVWTSVGNLSFDDRLIRRRPTNSEVAPPGFAEFVQSVFRRTHPVKINKLCLHWSRPTDLSMLMFWVNCAIVRYVREIELYVGGENRIELPDTIATCKTLEVLRLESNFVITVPPDGTRFPVLKVLKVCLQYPENRITESLFCSCPVLEDLTIKAYLNQDGETPNFVISSTTLKKLALTIAFQDFYFYGFDHTVTIAAPNLQTLHVTADVLGLYMVHDLQSVTSVKLEISFAEWAQGDPNHAVQLLEGVRTTKALTLSAGMISAVNEAYENFKPSFPELRYLEMKVGAYGWRILPQILSGSLQVETLVLHKECWFEVTEEDFGWLGAGNVPQCLGKRIQQIEIKGVEGNDDELQLLRYLLQYSEVLKTMVVRCKGCTSKKKMKTFNQKVRRLRRGGIDSQIELE